MGAPKSNDPYLIQRSAITENIDNAHLLEVDGFCPLCGKYLLATKGRRTSKLYQIAHIYPNSPTPAQVKELSDLERLGTNCEEFENKIALCKDCHGLYDDHTSKKEYLMLLEIKKRLLSISKAKIAISHQDLEDEIRAVIDALSTIDNSKLRNMKLNYRALKVSNKVEYPLLRNKIETYVCNYFNFIKEAFQNLEKLGQMNFNLVASEIRTSFLKCEIDLTSQSDTFESLVKWLRATAIGSSTEACEAVISYFVQSCEVFHEITK